MNRPHMTDMRIEKMISVLLRAGVMTSAAIVLTGGIYFLARHGAETADFRTFRGQPSTDRLLSEIAKGAISLRSRSIIEAGILVLIATPILRVLFSLAGFALERDKTYVLITALVLTILLYSLITGAVQA